MSLKRIPSTHEGEGTMKERTIIVEERTIIVEGYRLTKSAVEKAYAELQKPEPFRPGDIIQRVNERHVGAARFLVIGANIVDNINRGLRGKYGVDFAASAKDNDVRYTDGRNSFTTPAERLVKVGSLREVE